MNEILRLGLTLMAIGLIASSALALTNQFTEKIIKMQKEAKLKNSLSKVMPEAKHFEKKEDLYLAYEDDKLVGRVLKVDAQGYSSVIQLLVGLDLQNRVINIDVLSQVETPGLGANVEKESFLSQFKGKVISTLKLKRDNGNIDAITGATITSRAVTNGIRESFANYNLEDTQKEVITGESIENINKTGTSENG